jgi:hypothetical protein
MFDMLCSFLVFRMAPEVLQPGAGYNFKYVLNIILMICLLKL